MASITGIYFMNTLLKALKTLHVWLHFLVIFALSLLPIITSADIVSSFVYMPLGYLLLAFISFNIENKLNSYLTLVNDVAPKMKEKKCLIYRGICCLHS